MASRRHCRRSLSTSDWSTPGFCHPVAVPQADDASNATIAKTLRIPVVWSMHR
jgi:hypothetical protein